MATAAAIRQRIYDNLYGSFPTEAPFVTTLTATYTDAEGVIAEARRTAKADLHRVKTEFDIRWFAWRSAIPICLVSGYSVRDILFSTSRKPRLRCGLLTI